MISLYVYKLNLLKEMKIYSMFHVSLLLLSKHNPVEQQVPEPPSVIVKNEDDLYFVDSIDDMKWQTQKSQFKLLIKWEEYEQRIWESYTIIKKNASVLVKEFHEDHSSQPASVKWIKDKNQQLFSDTWITTQNMIQPTEDRTDMNKSKIMTLTKVRTQTWNITWVMKTTTT